MAKIEREILGHVDCPTCGTARGMRVTHDKNGEPFGYCEAECGQQLRIGGDRWRVQTFLKRYPWALAGAGQKQAATEPVAEPHVEKVAEVPTETKPKTVAPRSPFADACRLLGV